MAEESEARVSSWRAEIDRVTDEALSCTDATEEISKRSRIVKLWAAVVSKTNDAADKEQLALAEKQLYYAHLERLELEGITEAQRNASDRFVALYEDTVRAQLPGPQPRGPRTQLPTRRWRILRCLGGDYEDDRSSSPSPRSSLGSSDQSAAASADARALLSLNPPPSLQVRGMEATAATALLRIPGGASQGEVSESD